MWEVTQKDKACSTWASSDSCRGLEDWGGVGVFAILVPAFDSKYCVHAGAVAMILFFVPPMFFILPRFCVYIEHAGTGSTRSWGVWLHPFRIALPLSFRGGKCWNLTQIRNPTCHYRRNYKDCLILLLMYKRSLNFRPRWHVFCTGQF